MITRMTMLAGATVAMMLTASAQAADSGFLSDYSQLQSTPGAAAARMYLVPDIETRTRAYRGVFVDQPEIFISPDSKYQAIKPDDAKLIADALRESINAELQGGSFLNLNAPQPGSIMIRVALSDVMVQKKKRNILAYTPAGFVISSAKRALSSVMSNINLKSATVEIEIVDAASGEVLAAAVDARGLAGSPTTETSWDDVQAYLGLLGKRVACRLENAAKAEGARADCAAITMPEPEKK